MAESGKVLIIGAAGRMGAALARRYARTHEVIAFKRADLDVQRLSAIQPTLAALDFDCLIYTAGMTGVDYCEDHPQEAAITNAEVPRVLAEECKARGARFIHVSTDYVFSGEKPGARLESDPALPVNVYGQTKLDGERAVLAVSDEFLVLRVSWLFGPDRASFPDSILKQAQESERVEAVADKWSSPTYSEDLASWIEPMLDDARYRGVLHLSNRGNCTWQDYGQAVLDWAMQMGLPLKTKIVQPVSRHAIPAFRAIRPEHTELDTSRFASLSGITPRAWQDALKDYLQRKYGSSAP